MKPAHPRLSNAPPAPCLTAELHPLSGAWLEAARAEVTGAVEQVSTGVVLGVHTVYSKSSVPSGMYVLLSVRQANGTYANQRWQFTTRVEMEREWSRSVAPALREALRAAPGANP